MNVRLVLPDEVVVSENPRDANSREALEQMSSNAAWKEKTLRVEWLSLSCTTGLLPWTNLNGPDKYTKDSIAIVNDIRIMLVDINSLLVLFLFMVGANAGDKRTGLAGTLDPFVMQHLLHLGKNAYEQCTGNRARFLLSYATAIACRQM